MINTYTQQNCEGFNFGSNIQSNIIRREYTLCALHIFQRSLITSNDSKNFVHKKNKLFHFRN